MGLFSSKKKVSVSTAVVRVIDDKFIPYTHKTAVLGAIMQDLPISKSLTDGLSESIALKADRMFQYGRDHYYYGLPNHTFVAKGDGQAVVKKAIQTEIGQSVEILYFKYAPINSIHVAWKTLVEKYGYNHRTNEITKISAQVGHKVYLDDLIARYTPETIADADPEALEVWGTPALTGYANYRRGQGLYQLNGYLQHTPWVVDKELLTDEVVIKYTWSVWEKKMVGPHQTVEEKHYFDSIRIPITGYEEDDEYYQVMYRYGSDSRLGCWIYLDNSGKHPAVDAIHEPEKTRLGSYFPFVIIRSQGENQTGADYEFKAPYDTTKKLLSYLGLDFKELADAVHNNPGISDVIQAMMWMAVPAKGNSEVECAYLYEYFYKMYFESPAGPAEVKTPFSDSAGIKRRDGRAIVIQDADFKVTLRYSSIGIRRVSGKVGGKATYKSSSGRENTSEKYQDAESGQIKTRSISHEYISYKKQVNDTFYEEVRVYGLTLLYHVKGKYTTVAKGTSGNLLIPLDKAVTDTLPTIYREELYCRSLHFVTNTYIETSTKWYQSGWFKWVMVIIAVVITVWTWGTASPGVWAAISAGTVTITALAWAALKAIVISLAMRYGAKALAESLGPEWAMAIAIVAMAVGVYGSLGDSTWATNMLSMSTSLMDASSNEFTRLTGLVYDSLGQLQLLADEKMEEIRSAEKLLGVQDLLDPWAFIGMEPMVKFGEAPQDYYNRTVHAGNIGTMGIDAVSRYHEVALTLPRLTDTLGESSWGELEV